jgi:ParB family chromosome partitioning protein
LAKSKFNRDLLNSMSKSASMQQSKDSELLELKRELEELRDGDSVVKLNIESIIENPYQPRLEISDESLIELCNSIEEHGLLQPITVMKIDNDKFQLIAGHRRLKAHKLNSLTKIDAIIKKEVDDKKLQSLALLENLQRENLNVFEISLAIDSAINSKLYSTNLELGTSLGMDATTVGHYRKILTLPREIKDDVVKSRTTTNVKFLAQLNSLDCSDKQLNIWSMLKSGVKITQLNKEIQKIKKESSKELKSSFDYIKTDIDKKFQPIIKSSKKLSQDDRDSLKNYLLELVNKL